MSGLFTIDASPADLSEPAAPLAVCRYDPDSGYTLMPNLICERIERPIGAKPSTAQLRYILDTAGLYPDWPSQFETIWPQTAAAGPYVLSVDDRVVVLAWTPDGQRRVLFDGFAQIPQVNVSGASQDVTVVCTGVECRCWDVPILGRVQRDMDSPETNDGSNEFSTDLPVRFNPSHGKDGVIPNSTPTDYDHNQSGDSPYPVFLDENIKRSPDKRADLPDLREPWTVDRAVRYILGVHNDEKYVKNPAFRVIKDLLAVRPYIYDDSGNLTWDTTKQDAAPTRDLDVTNKCWPDAVETLLRSVGFGCYFDVDEALGEPVTTLYVYKLNEYTLTPKTVSLPNWQSRLDPAQCNVSQLALARDVNQIVNSWAIETHPRKWEVSIILAPGFVPSAGDANNRKQFLRSNLDLASAATRAKYRLYVADEAGDGHYDWDTGTWITNQCLDLSPIWPDNVANDGTKTRSYVRRARKGTQTLLSKDGNGKFRQAVVHWCLAGTGSDKYLGKAPAVWDGTATWKALAHGEWRLLDDQFGIMLTVEDPEAISTGKGKPALRGITAVADPTENNPFFYLMLTTVIEDDFMLDAIVPMRVSSPTKFERVRRHDARDHYQFWGVYYPSWYNNPPGPPAPNTDPNLYPRDDRLKALDLAAQYRAAHEMPPLAGSVTIPSLTNYYKLADRVKLVDGRNVDLRANTAPTQSDDDQPFYPIVVKVSWSFTGDQQTTTLQLSDLRAEPHG
jgi:hypothetical protein